MNISIIVAAANLNVIGKENKLLWHLPNDLKHFKKLTTGHCLLMGRKTFQSIGKALPNRTNLVISENTIFVAPDCYVFSEIELAIQKAMELGEEELFVIGGEQIYKLFVHFIDKIYLTKVHGNFEGDAFFPLTIHAKEWKEISKISNLPDEKHQFAYDFIEYERILPEM